MPAWYLYMVRCREGSLYTGITTDVKRRLREHKGEGKKGAKFLRGKGPLTLALKKKIGNRSLASKAEYRVKQLSKAEKERLVSGKLRFNKILRQILLRGPDISYIYPTIFIHQPI
ncbi:MAG: GIY-YIG nuclease family protein [Fibrobacterota bacterium]